MPNTKNANLGFDQSDVQSATVANTESETAILDLGRAYQVIRISIPDCNNIQSTTTLSFQVDYDGEGSLFNLWNENGQAAIVTANLPTDTTAITFLLKDAIGIRRIKGVFSQAVGGNVVVNAQGIDGGIERTP